MQKVVANKQTTEPQLVETKPTTKQEERFQALVTQNEEKEYPTRNKEDLEQKRAASDHELQKKPHKIHSKNEQSNSEKEPVQVLEIDPNLFQKLMDGQISLNDVFVSQNISITPDLIDALKQFVSSDVPSQEESRSQIGGSDTDQAETIVGEQAVRKVVSTKNSSQYFDPEVIATNAAQKDVLEIEGILEKVDQSKDTKPVVSVDVAKLSRDQQEILKKQLTEFLRARSPDETKIVQVIRQTEGQKNTQFNEKMVAVVSGSIELGEVDKELQAPRGDRIQSQHFAAQIDRSERNFTVSSKVVMGEKTAAVVQEQQVERLDLSAIVVDKEFGPVGSKAEPSVQISDGQKGATVAKPLEQVVRSLQKSLFPVVEKSFVFSKGATTKVVFNLKPANLGEMRVLVKTDQRSVNLKFEVQDSTVCDMLQKITHKLDQIMEHLQFEVPVKTVKQSEVGRQTVENAELFDEQQDADEFMQGEHAQQRKFARARKLRAQVVPDDHLPVEDRSGPGTISMLV